MPDENIFDDNSVSNDADKQEEYYGKVYDLVNGPLYKKRVEHVGDGFVARAGGGAFHLTKEAYEPRYTIFGGLSGYGAYDNFNRQNNATSMGFPLSGGSSWLTKRGQYGIVNQKAYVTGVSPSGSLAIVKANTSATGFVEVTLSGTVTGQMHNGVVFLSDRQANNFCTFFVSANTYYYQRTTNGVVDVSIPSFALGNYGDIVRVNFTSQFGFSAYVNGSLVLQSIAGFPITWSNAVYCGLYTSPAYASSSVTGNPLYFDDFSVSFPASPTGVVTTQHLMPPGVRLETTMPTDGCSTLATDQIRVAIHTSDSEGITQQNPTILIEDFGEIVVKQGRLRFDTVQCDNPTDSGIFFDGDVGLYSLTNGEVQIFIDAKTGQVTLPEFESSGGGGGGTQGPPGSDGASGLSGRSGLSGISGDSNGASGISGTSGANGTSGTVGNSGISGNIGTSGTSGISGNSNGQSGLSGISGQSGTAGFIGSDGVSGLSGLSGQSGTSGISGDSNGQSGISGRSGLSGQSGTSGTSGLSGRSGISGDIGVSGTSGLSGISGLNGSSTSGLSGLSGQSGFSGQSGLSGLSGLSGVSGQSGLSGISGDSNGTSGISGLSGLSGLSGRSGLSGISGQSGISGWKPLYWQEDGLFPNTVPFVNGGTGSKNAIAFGDGSSAMTINAIAGGSGAVAAGNASFALLNIVKSPFVGAYGDYSIALGYSAYVDNNSHWSNVLGGHGNAIVSLAASGGTYSSIMGGLLNMIHTSPNSFIGNGQNNTIRDSGYSFIGAGQNNYVTGGTHSYIQNGFSNTITASNYASIGAAYSASIYMSNYSSIGGGQNNSITSSIHSTIGGGANNNITNDSASSFIGAGSWNKIDSATISFIGAGTQNTIYNTKGGYIGGGTNNAITGDGTTLYVSSFIGGGIQNRIEYGNKNVIGGGETNLILTADHSFIGGGKNNTIISTSSVTSSQSFIVAGINNSITGQLNGILGGSGNTITSIRQSGAGSGNFTNSLQNIIIGGQGNNISGSQNSVVFGGINNSVSATIYAFVGGLGNIANIYGSTKFGVYGITHTYKGVLSGVVPTNGDIIFSLGNGTAASARNDSIWVNNIGGVAATSYSAQLHHHTTSAMSSASISTFNPRFGTLYYDNTPIAWANINVPAGGPPVFVATHNFNTVADITPGPAPPRIAGSTKLTLYTGLPVTGISILATVKGQDPRVISAQVNGSDIEVRTWSLIAGTFTLTDTDYYIEIMGRG